MPRERLTEMLGEVDRISAAYGLQVATLGHAGDGNLHPNFGYDPADADMIQRVSAAQQRAEDAEGAAPYADQDWLYHLPDAKESILTTCPRDCYDTCGIMVIKHNGELFSIHRAEHRTPGNLRAFVQARMRNLRTGAIADHRFRSTDEVERAMIDETEMQYLYADGDSYVFMNTENFEQLHLPGIPGR